MNTKLAFATWASLSASLFTPAPTALSAEWLVAPINPRFGDALAQRSANQQQSGVTAEGRILGYLPSPVLLPQARPRTPVVQKGLPTRYDLREMSALPPIRDQGSCGSCWAFATFGSLESFLLFRRNEARDFSEQDLNQRHGFDIRECEGGTHFMSMAYLARWAGPVNESAVPYPYTPAAPTLSRANLSAVAKHVQQVDLLPPRDGFLDNTWIKQTVMQTGGVLMGFEYRGDAYNDATAAFYTDTNIANHAVVIVGWDDAYPKDRFREDKRPPGDGAFIVRNSWGAEWGDQGYFYLSYYDRSATDFTAFHNARRTSNYTQIYQYDPLGWTHSIGRPDAPRSVAWFANIFPVATDARFIEAVSFYTPVADSYYVISVFERVAANDPSSGRRVSTRRGTLERAGYHTVRLRPGANLESGTKFSVVVKLVTPGFNYPVPIEARLSNYSGAANAYEGQSFVSADGRSWVDLATRSDVSPLNPLTELPFANVALKAFGRAAPTP